MTDQTNWPDWIAPGTHVLTYVDHGTYVTDLADTNIDRVGKRDVILGLTPGRANLPIRFRGSYATPDGVRISYGGSYSRRSLVVIPASIPAAESIRARAAVREAWENLRREVRDCGFRDEVTLEQASRIRGYAVRLREAAERAEAHS